MREIRHFVRGAYKAGRQKVIDKHVFDDSDVFLLRDPDNKHDSNAIAVFVEDDNGRDHQIGYLGRELAAELAPLVDAGHQVEVAWQETVDNLEGTGVKLCLRVADSPDERLPTLRSTGSDTKWALIITAVLFAIFGGFAWWIYSSIASLFS